MRWEIDFSGRILSNTTNRRNHLYSYLQMESERLIAFALIMLLEKVQLLRSLQMR